MKGGQAEIIGNVFMVFLGVAFLTLISILSYTLYTNQIRVEVENNLKQIGIGISNNVLKLYEIGKNSKYYPGINESKKIAEIDLKLPPKVSGRNYEIFLITTNPIWIQISNMSIDNSSISSVISYGTKILLRTTQPPEVTVEVDVPNIDVYVQGKSENGLDGSLSYYRYNINGSIKDNIILGKQDIIIDISEVS
jgi:hypothetical protein